MASEKTDAIVLRVVGWSESSAVVTLLTRDHGRISAVAKGARRLKSPFEAALDLLAVCRVVFIAKSGDVLDILTEAKLTRRFRSGQRDLVSLYCGYYLAELLLELTEEGQPIAELFELTDFTLAELDKGSAQDRLVLRFELQSLRILGLLPNFENCTGCTLELTGSSTVLFGLLSGGVLCRQCALGQRQVVRLKWETIKVFRQLSSPQGECQFSNRLDVECRGEARGVMNRYLTNLANRKFKMVSFLEELAF